MRGRRTGCDSRRHIDMKLLKLALLSLVAFSKPVQALQFDETSSQISAAGSTLTLANGTTQTTALVTTTDATTSQSGRSSSSIGASTPSIASTRASTTVGFNVAASGNQTRTVFTSSLLATPTGIRSFFPISNVSISASPSGNYTNGNYSDGGGDYVSLTLKGGYEPSVVCITTTQGAVPTTWSIVYTTTTTIYGDPTDYTPPEPDITIPVTCSPPAGLEGNKGKTKVSASVACTSEDGVDICRTEAPELPTFSSTLGPETTFTFVTTAKNPSVVFSPISTPRYGHDPETQAPQERRSSTKPTGKPTPKPTASVQSPNNDPRPPGSPGSPRESAKVSPKATYMITVAPTKIIINDQTFTQSDPSKTTKVTVNGDEFTINPSEVIGGGTIVDRPGNVGRSTMVPSRTMVGDLPIVIAPAGTQNVVVVGGTTFGVQATPITAVVEGQTITIEPTAVIVPDQNAPSGGAAPVTTVVKGQTITLVPSATGDPGGTAVSSGRAAPLTTVIDGQKTTIQPSAAAVPKRTVSISRASPVQTEIVVAGGEMITTIGPSVVVIRSTTFTYGLVSTIITKVVDDDTISIGPSGVTVRNITVGGPGAKATDTTYEIVGGASVTQVGASVVVVDGTSFTVGPGKATTTEVFGGETITIGPSGVVVSTITLPYPFGPTVITTIDVPSTAAAPSPVPSETKKNGGGAVRPARALTGLHLDLCIAIGVWVLGHMF
ncbi:hypothetical protein BDP81DRAFT_468621 [Colletotrichum phormii]|uniref:Cell agglutination protein n=1 Tax=Colletotrichum phormii TaxID=359342 RepID=A0AAJ0ELH2_9PEZI|nr:uncharacterized protein BDP81DRAFT_468621 [Colletotrichum phormii]KAK1641066.1 hypothetical protein BDP81DRAFT_468621 [Colletotrichum phormii]